MNGSEMSVCEQSFHFASVKDAEIGSHSKMMMP